MTTKNENVRNRFAALTSRLDGLDKLLQQSALAVKNAVVAAIPELVRPGSDLVESGLAAGEAVAGIYEAAALEGHRIAGMLEVVTTGVKNYQDITGGLVVKADTAAAEPVGAN